VTWSDRYPDKIRIAEPGDPIVGIVTTSAGIVGNSAELAWHGAIEHDEYNQPRVIYDRYADLKRVLERIGLVTDGRTEAQLSELLITRDEWAWFNDPSRVRPLTLVPSQNFDPTRKYIPRSKRSEWACVGIMGQLVVREAYTGASIPGKKVSIGPNGKAILGEDYRVLRRIGPETVLIFVR
jgi:hypothetical protein